MQANRNFTLFEGIQMSSVGGGGGMITGGNGTWLQAIETMGKWYEQNIHTYGATLYECPLLPNGGKVRVDCSGFVCACLNYFGVNVPISSTSEMQPGSTYARMLEAAGFIYESSSKFDIYSSTPGDILCGPATSHTEIFAGGRKSWGWGSVHDGIPPHPGMPSYCNPDAHGKPYIHRWRLPGMGFWPTK